MSERNVLADLVSTNEAKQGTEQFRDILDLGNTSVKLANEIVLAEIEQHTKIDLRKIHCSKTGQPIAELNSTEIERLVRFHGVNRLEEIAHELDLATGISRVWLHTEPDTLNKLQRIDPRGFFCYCIGVALQSYHMQYIDSKRQFPTIEAQRKFRNSLVRAWYMLANVNEDRLHDVNIKLRFFMFLDLHNRKFYRVPWHLLRLPVAEKEYAQALQTYRKNTYKPIGKHGEALLVNPERPTKEDFIFTDKLAFAAQDAMLRAASLDVERNPMLPEEFATERGMEWIITVLGKHLASIQKRMRYNEVAYAHLHVANAFRSGKAFKGDAAEYEYMLDHIGPIEQSLSLRELVARSKRIKDAHKTKAYVAQGPLVDLKLNINSAGEIDIDLEETETPTVAQRATAQAVSNEQQQPKPATISIPKINLGNLKK